MTWPTKTDFVDGDVLTAAQVNNIGTNLNEANPTGITDGFVLTADGAGGMGWEAVQGGAYTTITSGSLSGTTLDLTSIPQTYTDLVLHITNMRPSTTNNWSLRVNGITSTNYNRIGQQAATNQANGAASYVQLDTGNWNNGNDLMMVFIFQNYTVSQRMNGRIFITSTDGSSLPGGFWVWNTGTSGTINRITIASVSGATFTTGTYKLLGVK